MYKRNLVTVSPTQVFLTPKSGYITKPANTEKAVISHQMKAKVGRPGCRASESESELK